MGRPGIYPAKPIDHRAQLALQTRSNLVRSRPGRSAFLLRLWSYLAVQQRAKLSLHVPPLRAAVGRPGFRLRFCASGCLPCFAFSALPGLFTGLLACVRYICPAACLCALYASLSGLPSLPFSIRAAACCSASALPSIAAVLCLPKEERPPGFVPWSASLLRCLLWPCRGFPAYGLKTKAARLCSASLPRPKEGCGSALLRLRCLSLRLSMN